MFTLNTLLHRMWFLSSHKAAVVQQQAVSVVAVPAFAPNVALHKSMNDTHVSLCKNILQWPFAKNQMQ